MGTAYRFIEDLGSGAIVDLEPFGIRGRPTVQRSPPHAGVDVASFSGDKLLGGPQAGLIVGKGVHRTDQKHPLARALRLDKMTLAALRDAQRAYLDAEIAVREIPTLRDAVGERG